MDERSVKRLAVILLTAVILILMFKSIGLKMATRVGQEHQKAVITRQANAPQPVAPAPEQAAAPAPESASAAAATAAEPPAPAPPEQNTAAPPEQNTAAPPEQTASAPDATANTAPEQAPAPGAPPGY